MNILRPWLVVDQHYVQPTFRSKLDKKLEPGAPTEPQHISRARQKATLNYRVRCSDAHLRRKVQQRQRYEQIRLCPNVILITRTSDAYVTDNLCVAQGPDTRQT